MMRIKSSKPDTPNPPGDNWLWGVENAREINRKKHQVYPLLPQLMEAAVVKRFGHKS